MFKTTQDKLDDIARTASHATKPFATGRVEVLPPEARPWEEVYLTFREQYDTALTKLDTAFQRLREVDAKLLDALPASVFAQTVRIRAQYGEQVKHYKEVCAALRADCKRATENSQAWCFMQAAQRVLTDEQYQICVKSADEMRADVPSSGKLTPQIDPPRLTGKADGSERRRQQDDYKSVLHPNSERAARAAAKQAKYGHSGTASAKATGPQYRVVHREF